MGAVEQVQSFPRFFPTQQPTIALKHQSAIGAICQHPNSPVITSWCSLRVEENNELTWWIHCDIFSTMSNINLYVQQTHQQVKTWKQRNTNANSLKLVWLICCRDKKENHTSEKITQDAISCFLITVHTNRQLECASLSGHHCVTSIHLLKEIAKSSHQQLDRHFAAR